MAPVASPAYEGPEPGPSTLERRDLDGRVDCENGVIGDVRLAEVLVAPSVEEGNAVFRLAGTSAVLGLRLAESAINVSTHFAAARISKGKSFNAVCAVAYR